MDFTDHHHTRPTPARGWFPLAAVINDPCGNCGMPLDKGHTCTPGDGAR